MFCIHNEMGRFLAGALALALGVGGAAFAADPGKPEVKVQLEGSIRQPGASGASWKTMSEDRRVIPGEVIRYSVALVNEGGKEALHPVALGPIPAGTLFIDGTATTGSDLKVAYSLDGGKSFAEKPTVTVTGKDGKPQTVPAPVERYTTIRWTWSSPLAAGARMAVSYQVRVR